MHVLIQWSSACIQSYVHRVSSAFHASEEALEALARVQRELMSLEGEATECIADAFEAPLRTLHSTTDSLMKLSKEISTADELMNYAERNLKIKANDALQTMPVQPFLTISFIPPPPHEVNAQPPKMTYRDKMGISTSVFLTLPVDLAHLKPLSIPLVRWFEL